MRRAYTLPEVLVVLALIGLAAAVALPPLARLLDRAAVREAADRYGALHHEARRLAVARGRLARIELDTAAGQAVVGVRRSPTAWDTVRTEPLGSARIATGQPVVTFGPQGLGFGLSNTRLVFERGTAAETVTVSRTGRLKR